MTEKKENEPRRAVIPQSDKGLKKKEEEEEKRQDYVIGSIQQSV